MMASHHMALEGACMALDVLEGACKAHMALDVLAREAARMALEGSLCPGMCPWKVLVCFKMLKICLNPAATRAMSRLDPLTSCLNPSTLKVPLRGGLPPLISPQCGHQNPLVPCGLKSDSKKAIQMNPKMSEN